MKKRRKAKRTSNKFRSKFEEKIASMLEKNNIKAGYETMKIKYVTPAKERTYTPDFIILKNNIIIETKGRFLTADRQKHLCIKEQHPELDIRFVFYDSSQKLNKYSKTTYAEWCKKNGFKYADKEIPKEWVDEEK